MGLAGGRAGGVAVFEGGQGSRAGQGDIVPCGSRAPTAPLPARTL